MLVLIYLFWCLFLLDDIFCDCNEDFLFVDIFFNIFGYLKESFIDESKIIIKSIKIKVEVFIMVLLKEW